MSVVKKILAALFLSIPVLLTAQNDIFWKASDTLNIKRRNTVYITEAAGASMALIGLNQLWYANYDRSKFHFINDNNEWLQMDKAGHLFSSYYLGKLSMDALNWAGENKKNQLLYGAGFGLAFLTTVEVLDGFSSEWGFSTGDMVANTSGTILLAGQELLWDEQRNMPTHARKYSARTSWNNY